MNLSDLILRGDFGTAQDDLTGIILGLLIAFLCGHVVAWVYIACHSGLSYSRSFVNSLIVLCVIVSLVMAVMFNNLLMAFGMMAPESVRSAAGGELAYEMRGPAIANGELPWVQSVEVRAANGESVMLSISILNGRAEVVGVSRGVTNPKPEGAGTR